MIQVKITTKKMKLFNRTKFIKFLAVFTLVGMSLAWPSYAAPEDLVVDFESTPLFSEANFMPGNTVTRTVKVTNNTGGSKDIVVEAINVTDPDDFSEALNIAISEGDSELYSDTLSNFFSDGEVDLSAVAGSGGSATYNFSITFVSSSGNSYQENDLGFDIIVGFKGEGGGEESGGGDGGGGSGGGGSGGGGSGGGGGTLTGLTIVDDTVRVIDIETTSVTIIWSTSYRSTSRVVYGTTPGLFDISSLPNYGYPFSTVEADTPAPSSGVYNHSVIVSGLIPGTTYYFRAISHASPDTVSFEHNFSTLILNPGNPNQDEGQGNSSAGNAIVAGLQTGFDGDDTTGNGGDNSDGSGDTRDVVVDGDSNEEDTDNLFASIYSSMGSFVEGYFWWILFLLIIIIILFFLRRRKDDEDNPSSSS